MITPANDYFTTMPNDQILLVLAKLEPRDLASIACVSIKLKAVAERAWEKNPEKNRPFLANMMVKVMLRDFPMYDMLKHGISTYASNLRPEVQQSVRDKIDQALEKMFPLFMKSFGTQAATIYTVKELRIQLSYIHNPLAKSIASKSADFLSSMQRNIMSEMGPIAEELFAQNAPAPH